MKGCCQSWENFYGDIYLSQGKRLKGMEYLDFVLSEVHGLRIRELQDAQSPGPQGYRDLLCVRAVRTIRAADAVCVGLCAGAEIGKEAAEKILPRNTCALIKWFVGFKLSRLCPYISHATWWLARLPATAKKGL